MMKTELDKFIEDIPVFDCVALKRKIQAEIYEETKHMTWKEKREYYRQGAERFDREIERLRAECESLESQS